MTNRIFYLDLARGLAILLMFVDHISVALVSPGLRSSRFPEIVIMPLMAIVEFAPPLFFLVFGFTLSYFYNENTSKIYQKKMLIRAAYIFFWYKILCIVELVDVINYQLLVEIINFKLSNDFVEVLSFFAFFLLWFAFAIKKWNKLKLHYQLFIIASFILTGFFLQNIFAYSFLDYSYFKAILFEDKHYFHFGQLQRGAIALLGSSIAIYYKKNHNSTIFKLIFVFSLQIMLVYLFHDLDNLKNNLTMIGYNVGKHPPNYSYFIFSTTGALFLFSFVFFIPAVLKPYLKWISIIGKNSLFSFQIHILYIFVILRYYLNLKNRVTYNEQILFLILLILFILLWDKILNKKKLFANPK